MTLRLGIDIGTSGVRTAVLTEDGTVLPMARADHVAQDPDRIDANGWWTAVRHCVHAQIDLIRSAGRSPDDIIGIAVDGTSGTMVLTDAALAPVTRALMYNSKGFTAEAETIAALAPDPHITRGSASALGRAMRLASEDTDARAAHLLHQADFIAAKLMGTGGHSDHNNALKTGFDPETDTWPDWFAQTNLPMYLLPQVHPVGTPLGPISGAVAADLGLPKTATIHAGTTDSIAAFLASAPMQAGAAVTSLGTTLAVKLLSPTRVDAPAIGLYSHKVGDHWLVGGASNTGGGVLLDHFTADQIKTLSGSIDPSTPSPLDYYPLSVPGERFPVNDPTFAGNMAPRPDDDIAFLHGLLQGIAQVEARCYAEIERLCGMRPSVLFTAGGGAQNPTWTEIRERALGLHPQMPTHQDAAVGAASLV